ncbi:Lysine N-acyltransferase MbtK OS=Tsukamurella paurometabola (strain ATCC 8368 / DSM / CCUG 35730/ CIP 100753 / JCM 10117 / KCTC 9821 / NBRC 16120 / NCIMB 702349 / NCTC 13040) OX=521096 GN=Tpau_4324 PE=3 SV=1 [Tsukamurella paurometabola]|uniref:Lysine N-acyltransferase MbtK n=1 Tax=Tsukamurella paurometabola (strain ATCC 8368 / DSM 20162 / CCUG 35730 / CIP 100753 / JCM 10117 / KCTC 9821 / NBRC 16120 / NCIMB 702349 / NCTC 13040) TaxID=521096 RepID=D5UZ38_TSUPD|nr:GNAT family N-acetyltransferase [Tsukamurella paurometabola]ADG80885.1 Siderophore biosynthesis protein, conserved region [Tsukamurella paurometabola DSM 20162]SUQ39251.1 Lysine N-acyltransferase mbtK [Tsukamurella paurometabola]
MAESDSSTRTLPRQRPDPSPAHAAVPGPVVPVLHGRFGLRVVDPEGTDPQLIARWMALPHLVATWEQPWSAAQWAEDARLRLRGDYSVPVIFTVDGADAGYVELYRVTRDEVGGTYDAHPHDMGFHIATGETGLIGRGVITAFITELADGVLTAEPQCRRMVGDPAVDNARIHRALTKAGFVHRDTVDVRPGRRISLFIRSRPDD